MQGNLVVNEIARPRGTDMMDMQDVRVHFLTAIYPTNPLLGCFLLLDQPGYSDQGEEAYSRSVVRAGRWHFKYLPE